MDFSNATIWSGNTYAICNELRSEGAAFKVADKTWILPPVTDPAAIVRVTRLKLKPGVEVRTLDINNPGR